MEGAFLVSPDLVAIRDSQVEVGKELTRSRQTWPIQTGVSGVSKGQLPVGGEGDDHIFVSSTSAFPFLFFSSFPVQQNSSVLSATKPSNRPPTSNPVFIIVHAWPSSCTNTTTHNVPSCCNLYITSQQHTWPPPVTIADITTTTSKGSSMKCANVLPPQAFGVQIFRVNRQ